MKNKNLNKALLIAASAAMVVPIVADLTVNSVEVNAASTTELSQKQQGDIIKLGGKNYYVVSQKYGGTLVMAVDTTPKMNYDPDNTNTFDPSDSNNIGYYLNNTYYNSLSEDVKKVIKSVDWHIGNEKNESAKTVNANVGMLTLDDYGKAGINYGGKIPGTDSFEWIITPVSFYSFGMYGANKGVLSSFTVNDEFIARPALVLPSDILVSSDNEVITTEQPSIVGPSEPSIDIDFDNSGDTSNGSNGSINLDDYFDNTSPGDIIFTPTVLVNEAQADVSVVQSNLIIKNAKQDGLVSINVEAENSKGEKAQALFNLYVKANDGDSGDNIQDRKATLKLIEGEFTLKTSGINDFGQIKLTAAKQTVTTGFAENFGLIDARGTQEGWNVTVSSTPFEVETFEGFVGTPHQLPMGSLALKGFDTVQSMNENSTPDNLPSSIISDYTIIDNQSSVKLLSANEGQGMGQFDFSFSEDALALTVDAKTAKIDNVNYPSQPTPYVSTVTWDLVTGP